MWWASAWDGRVFLSRCDLGGGATATGKIPSSSPPDSATANKQALRLPHEQALPTNKLCDCSATSITRASFPCVFVARLLNDSAHG